MENSAAWIRDGDTLWIIGTSIEDTEKGQTWEFKGVVSKEETAVKACATKDDFIAPAILGQILSDEPEDWPGCYRPLEKEND